MTHIIISYQRGTSSFHSEDFENKWFKKEHLITRISRVLVGQKISIQKGTKTVRILKKPNPAIPNHQKIMITNKGTQRLILKN